MKNKRNYIICGIIALVAIVLIIIGVVLNNKKEESSVETIKTEISVTIDGVDKTESVVINKGETVADQYKKSTYNFDDSKGYVTKIDGKESEGMCGFVYEVNDTEIMEATNEHKLENNDKVHWFYTCFEG